VIPICSGLLAEIDVVSVRIAGSYRTLCDKCRAVIVCMVGLETRERVFLALITEEQEVENVHAMPMNTRRSPHSRIGELIVDGDL
jgi:hypothetical protein